MKNSELLELVGKKVSFEVHEDMHIGENKTITWQAGLSGELTWESHLLPVFGFVNESEDGMVIVCYALSRN